MAAVCGNHNPPAPHGSCSILPEKTMERGFTAATARARTRDLDDNRTLPGKKMFEFRDLFQWDRFITPTIIKTFYWLVIALVVLFGLSGIFSGLAAMAISPFGGFLMLLASLVGVIVGIVFSRIAAEFVLIVFRINEHLGAIRDQGRIH